MHKKQKVNGHVVHKLPKCVGLYYTVEPENGRIVVYMLKYDEGTGEPYYYDYGHMNICAKQLGSHGYLQGQIDWLIRKYSDTTPIRSYLEHEKLMNGDLKVLNNTIFKEEKKMTEYYVIDVEMTDDDFKTKRTECLQIRQSGNYFEIPFDGPAHISECRLDGLEQCLHNYIIETNKMFRVSLEKSKICSNSVLKITTPYGDISDDANREELCKMLTYAAAHGECPHPASKVGLSKIYFHLRECNNRVIYKKVYPIGITGKLHIGRGEFGFGVTRDELYKVNRGAIYYYIPENRDPTVLEFKNGKYVRGDNDGGLTTFAPFNLWRSIFGDDRFYETWDDVKKAVVKAINNRKIYVNVPCIPELREENCCIDD